MGKNNYIFVPTYTIKCIQEPERAVLKPLMKYSMLIISGMYSQENIGMAFWVIRHKTGRLAHSWALGSWDTECQDCQRAAGVSTVRLGHCQMTHLYWQTVTDAKCRHSQRANWHQTERICKSLCLWHKAKLFCIFIHEFCTYYSLCATIDCSFYLYFSSLLEGKTFSCMFKHKYPFN